MNVYNKPKLKTFTEKNILDNMGTNQTSYPVQFSIQAIEFQVSENTNQTEQLYTFHKNLRDIA